MASESVPLFPFTQTPFMGNGLSSGATLLSNCSLCFPHKTEYKPMTTKMEPIALHSQI